MPSAQATLAEAAMTLLLMYWKHLLAVSLLLVAGWAIYAQGGKSAKLECAQAQLEVREAADAAIAQAQQAATEANEAVRAELAKPRPGQTIREVSHANPSDCTLPAAVADSVRQAVDTANSRATAK